MGKGESEAKISRPDEASCAQCHAKSSPSSSRHRCLLALSSPACAEALVQLSGQRLPLFLEGMRFASPRDKVLLSLVLDRRTRKKNIKLFPYLTRRSSADRLKRIQVF